MWNVRAQKQLWSVLSPFVCDSMFSGVVCVYFRGLSASVYIYIIRILLSFRCSTEMNHWNESLFIYVDINKGACVVFNFVEAPPPSKRMLCWQWVGSGIRQSKRYFIGLSINVRICLLLKSQPPGHVRMKYQLDSEHFIMCVFVMRVSGNKVISHPGLDVENIWYKILESR